MRTSEEFAEAARREWAANAAEWERMPADMTNDELAGWLEKYNNSLTATTRYRDELLGEVVRRLRKP